MKRIVNVPSYTVPPTTPAKQSPESPVSFISQLQHLSGLGGLTEFEREFVARLRAKQPDQRELTVLAHIWRRHGRKTR